jgi:hypothetical protein
LPNEDHEDIARIKGAHDLGLAFVRSIILLNGGAFAVLLAYMAGSSTESLVSFQLSGLQCAMSFFLTGIVSVLITLIVSYVYTALNFLSPMRQWLGNKIILLNAFFCLFSLASFVSGVSILIWSAETQ